MLKRGIFLTGEFQTLTDKCEWLLELEDDHFASIIVKTDLSENHQYMLKLG